MQDFLTSCVQQILSLLAALRSSPQLLQTSRKRWNFLEILCSVYYTSRSVFWVCWFLFSHYCYFVLTGLYNVELAIKVQTNLTSITICPLIRKKISLLNRSQKRSTPIKAVWSDKSREVCNIWLIQKNEGRCNTALMSGLDICSSSPLYLQLHVCTLSHCFT